MNEQDRLRCADLLSKAAGNLLEAYFLIGDRKEEDLLEDMRQTILYMAKDRNPNIQVQ